VLGIIILILRRLPEAQNIKRYELKKDSPDTKLKYKGIPAESFSKVKAFIKFWLHKLWSAALEAKDLTPHQPSAYKLKKIFRFKTENPDVQSVTSTLSVRSPDFDGAQPDEEIEILEHIKREPKNHQLYDKLGRLYLKKQQYQDAKDLYLYLVGHEAGNSHFHARLAQSAYHLKDYALASKHFEKSLGLDKMHPNRYYNLGLSLECLEKWPEAIKAFTRAVEMDPENKKYTDALERVKVQV
jgi:tetratricopeptide (TPR) repeat protein